MRNVVKKLSRLSLTASVKNHPKFCVCALKPRLCGAKGNMKPNLRESVPTAVRTPNPFDAEAACARVLLPFQLPIADPLR